MKENNLKNLDKYQMSYEEKSMHKGGIWGILKRLLSPANGYITPTQDLPIDYGQNDIACSCCGSTCGMCGC